MINIGSINSRLRSLGYDQSSINWLIAQHISCGTLEALIAEINRMELVEHE